MCSHLWAAEGESCTHLNRLVLYAAGLLTPSEGNLSVEIRGKRLGGSFDFVYTAVADEVRKRRYAYLCMVFTGRRY